MNQSFDYQKYKNRLKQYIGSHGIDTSKSSINCINPEHDDDTPSMLLYDEYYQCQSCGTKGDIYDAVGLLEGIQKKAEQYKYIDNLFGIGTIFNEPQKKKDFKIDPVCEKKLREYVASQNGNGKINVRAYLDRRGCTEDMKQSLSGAFSWWPGFDQAVMDLGWDVMKGAGIPLIHPEKKVSSWGPAGVVAKIGTGFKLFYYNDDNKSMKIGSKKCKTFPFPKLPTGSTINLVEGEMSAISMLYAGFNNTIATGGVNGLSNENIKELNIFDKIYIIFDSDTAGRKNREILRQKLKDNEYSGDIFIVRLPDRKDPDDLIKEENTQLIHDAINKAEIKEHDQTKPPTPQPEKHEVYNLFPFVFAGFDHQNYYVIPKNQNIPIRIGRSDSSIKGMIFDIANPGWWADKFPKILKNDYVVADIPECIAYFRRKSQQMGMYDETKLLGVGAHIDGDDIIVNMGDGLYIQSIKERREYTDYESNNIYRRSTNRFDISGEPWKKEQSTELLYELLNYGFSNHLDVLLVCGYFSLAPFASILSRRPHIAITGAKGVGKTTLIQNIIRPAIGELGIYVEGETSAAGIRQHIGTDCRPCIVDEFEPHNTEDQIRNKNVLSLARSAYGGEGEIIKGTTGQKAIIFKTKMMFMFSAINIIFDNDADRTRIPIIKMQKCDKEIGKQFEFAGLRRRMFDNIWNTLVNIELAKKHVVEVLKFDHRTADTYGTLIAGFWSMLSDKPFLHESEEKIIEFVQKGLVHIGKYNSDSMADEEYIIDAILNHQIVLAPNDKRTISEMVTIETAQLGTIPLIDYDMQLRQVGIRRSYSLSIDGTNYNCLAISAHNQFLRKILLNTPWAEYRNILIRHPASIFEDTRAIRMIAGKKERCIILDWDKLKEMHFFEDENNNPF